MLLIVELYRGDIQFRVMLVKHEVQISENICASFFFEQETNIIIITVNAKGV